MLLLIVISIGFAAFAALIAIAIRAIQDAKIPNKTGIIEVRGSTQRYSYELGRINSSLWGRGIQVKLPVFLPNIVVDSHLNDKYGTSLVFAAFEEQRMELEGDFYQDCSVYVPKDYEQVALQLLTPDVMQLLQSQAEKFDLEIIGRTMNILTRTNPARDPELEKQLIETATVLARKTRVLVSRWNSELHDNEAAMLLQGYDHPMNKLGRFQIGLSSKWEIYIAVLALALLFWLGFQYLTPT